jgi:hypothetical protein
LNLKDEIIIIDEAHNIEDSCRDSTTFTITKSQLEISKTELNTVGTICTDEKIITAIQFFVRVVTNHAFFSSRKVRLPLSLRKKFLIESLIS